jgi:hypothetical protein
MARFLPNFTTTLKQYDRGIWYRQRYLQTGGFGFLTTLNKGLATFTAASSLDTHDDGTMDEISGLYAMTQSGNENYFVGVDDSVGTTMFIVDRDFNKNSTIALESDTWTDAEEVSGYTDLSGNHWILLMEFGDNAAALTTKHIYRFKEPTVDGVNLTIAASGYEKIPFVYPSSPIWEGGGILGDAEASFADPIDGKIYIMSKRETRNFIFSLPIQDSYTGTQTLSYHGEMVADVVEETGGVISPANAVAAAISNGNDNVFIKTYNKVYQFHRDARNVTWSQVMTQSAPVVETNYVGRGTAPSQEPQGESICFEYNDQGYFTISEFNGGGSVPFFYYPLDEFQLSATLGLSFRTGQDGYTGMKDTYIDGDDRTFAFSLSPTYVSDQQTDPETNRYAIEQWEDLSEVIGQLSSNIEVTSAGIEYYVSVEGQGFTLHEVTSAFDIPIEDITYNTLDGVLSADAQQFYNSTAAGTWPGDDGFVGTIYVPVSASVIQDWIRNTNPTIPNWFYHNPTDSADGQQLSSAEAPELTARPILHINYTFVT